MVHRMRSIGAIMAWNLQLFDKFQYINLQVRLLSEFVDNFHEVLLCMQVFCDPGNNTGKSS